MSIQYSGGVNVNTLYAGVTSTNSVLAHINTSLTAAGWTSTAVKAFVTLTASGDAANNDTITLAGKTYTFKTSINNSNDGEVTRGSGAADTLSNLKAALNLGAGSGTAYSSATTLNATLEGGTLTSTTLVIQEKTGGQGNNVACSESVTNMTLSGGGTIGGGYKFDTAITPQLLQARLYVSNQNSGTTITYFQMGNVSETSVQGANGNVSLDGGASFDLRIIANKYQCFIMIDGTPGGTGAHAFWGGGVPWLPNFLAGYVVTAATNATPIKITTSAAHGFTTGDSVTIRGALGNTAANVTNNAITVVDTTNFTIDASVGNGAWTSGGSVAKVGVHLCECIWSCMDFFIRNKLSANQIYSWTALNGSTMFHPNGTGALQFMGPIVDDGSLQTTELAWFNASNIVSEPFLCFGTAAANYPTINGQLWDAVLVRKAVTRDTTGTFDSHNWWNLTSNNTSDAFIGSIIHVVP